MNAALWVLQVLLALHTAMGALWKIFNSEQAVSSLNAIPHGAWLGLSGLEVLCVVGLIIPAVSRRLAIAAPIAAAAIAAEMILYSVVHLASGNPLDGQIVYWSVVAVVCAFIAYGRFVLKPLVR